MFRTERRIIIFNYENILNKSGKDKILIVILAGILLMVISVSYTHLTLPTNSLV